VETVREPLVMLTPDLRVIKANRSFYDRFHVTAEETEGRFVYSIGDHSLDIPAFFLLQSNGVFDKLVSKFD
jgi:PAS domain-containing protein